MNEQFDGYLIGGTYPNGTGVFFSVGKFPDTDHSWFLIASTTVRQMINKDPQLNHLSIYTDIFI